MNINELDHDKMASAFSSEHISNLIKDFQDKMILANALAKEVMQLNEHSGELGAGKCLNMKALAEELLNELQITM